jgi:hypothetical protein
MAVKTKAQVEQEQLKNDVNDLKAMMMQFLQGQNQQKSQETTSGKSVVEEEKDTQFDEVEEVQVSPQHLINVTSLFTGGLSLIGSQGKVIRFERFGQTMPITFEDLNHACSNARTFAEEGYFYIHSENAIKLLYLSEAYEKIIDAKKIENIISLPKEKIEEIYNKVAKNIKVSIVDIIVRGIQANKPAYQDRNKIDFISKIYGKDLDVMAKNLKEYDIK